MKKKDPSVLTMADPLIPEALLRAIIESSEDAIIGESLDGLISLWNPGAERLFGYTSAEAIGQTSELIVPVDRRAEQQQVRDRGLRGERLEHYETVRTAKDGRPVEVSLTVSPIRGPSGALVVLSHILRDIGERRKLEHQASHLSALVQSSDDAIASKDLDGMVRTWNPAAERLFGYTASEIIGQSIRVIIPPDRWAEEDELLRRLRRGDRIEHFETIRQRKNGTLVPISLTVSPIRDASGAVVGASKIARDLTLQRALARDKNRLGAIVESSDDAIVSKDLNGVIQTWNPAAERMFGYSASEAIGRSITLIIPEDRLGEEDEVLARVRRGERIDHLETIRQRKDGTLVPISLTVTPIHDHTGKVIGASKTARDLSALRAYATTLEETVRERTASLEIANSQLESFAYSVSHDLRAPLRGMYGLAHALVEDYGDTLDEQARDYARRIVHEASNLDRLIRDLLEYSRLTRIDVALEAVDVQDVVDAALHNLNEDIRARHAVVEVEPDLPQLRANRSVLIQVLTNLISNAVKFGGPQPTVRVRAQNENGRARIWVEDEGIGIAPKHHERIFRAFERLHGEERYPGTGIGLAIVHKAIERLGGRVGVESQEGRGSRFWFELPRAEAA
jgi:PAS domain S-box-containing protein